MKCSKCGAPEPPPTYHPARPGPCYGGTYTHRCPGFDNGKEHLAYTCRCGYAWTTPTLDGEPPT